MTADELLLPVLPSQSVRGWPGHPDAPPVAYVDAAEAFTRSYPTDAHFATYSVPSKARRLTLDAIGLVPWLMILLVVDVDAPGHGEKPTTDEARAELQARREAWWAAKLPKLAALEAAHPGALVYRSRSGGYRLVWRLASPFDVNTTDDKEAWRLSYRRRLLYLARAFGIEGDPTCADVTRLYRLPLVTPAPGEPMTVPDLRGDPAAIGIWGYEPGAEQLGADIETARSLAARHPGAWGPVLRALAPPSAPGAEARGEELRPENQDEARVWKRAESYLGSMAPSIQGSGGDQALWDAALAMVRGFALGPSTGAALLWQLFNPRCSPPWERRDVERKAREAAERSAKPWGYLRDAEGGEKGLRHKPSERRMRTSTPRETGAPRAPGAAVHDQEHDQASPPAENAPEIIVGVDLQGNIDAGTAALAACDDLFTRSTTLSQIVLASDPEHPERDGTPILRTLPKATLRARLCSAAQWLRADPRGGDDWKPTIPSDAIVQGIADAGRWPELRPLLGIARTPFLRRDGSVCEAPGYDKATAYTLVCAEPFPAVPVQPSQEDAARSLGSILDLFCDFPFVDEASRHVPVAALLTMLAMPALGGANVPAFLIEANTPGTGKGLLLDVVCLLATGREAAKTAWRENDEMEKILGAAALEGAGVLAFDNISQKLPFGGSAVDLVLTCSGQYKPRILGRSETPTLPWRAVILGTGNNITIAGDTRRRVLLCRQQTALERPDQRDDFRYPELRREARQRRGELVTAALTILRAHALAGRPAAGVRRVGSFEEWGTLIASAIAWAGGAVVTDAMPRAETSDDPTLSALGTLLEAWPLFDPQGRGIPLRVLAEQLYPESVADELGHVRDALELLAPAKGNGPVRFDARALGYVLRSYRGRNLGGLAFKEGKKSLGSQTWIAVDPLTGQRPCPAPGRGSEGSRGSFTDFAGAQAPAHERAGSHTHAGSPPEESETSPTSPASPGDTAPAPLAPPVQEPPAPPAAAVRAPPPAPPPGGAGLGLDSWGTPVPVAPPPARRPAPSHEPEGW